MKAFASILMLVLLLCNMLGLSLSVLCFEREYEVAVPVQQNESRILKIHVPLSEEKVSDYEVEGGLYRLEDQLYNVSKKVQVDDTLYIVLQPNAAAWQRFSELSEMMQEIHSDQKATHPISQIIKMLRDLTKVYLNSSLKFTEYEKAGDNLLLKTLYADLRCTLISEFLDLPSPPPKRS